MNKEKDVCVKLITTNISGDTGVFFRNTGVTTPFEVICLGVTNTSSPYNGKLWYWVLMFLLSNIYLIRFFLLHKKEFDAVYFRDETLFLSAMFAKIFARKSVFFEVHSVLERKLRQFMNVLSARFSSGVIAISSGLKRHYENYNKNVLLSLCSAAETSWFDYSQNKDDIRRYLKLPKEAFLIGYTGVIGANPNNDYYEIDDIVKSLTVLPGDIMFVVVGELNGNGDWLRKIAEEEKVLNRIIILPWQERSEIPKYLQAFDVNLIPKRKKDLVGDSPAKMFPALAARKPIIAGRAECIAEVLTDGFDAIFVKENTSHGWAEAIMMVYEDEAFGEKLSKQASVTCGEYTWEKRGASIANFIKKSMEKE